WHFSRRATGSEVQFPYRLPPAEQPGQRADRVRVRPRAAAAATALHEQVHLPGELGRQLLLDEVGRRGQHLLNGLGAHTRLLGHLVDDLVHGFTPVGRTIALRWCNRRTAVTSPGSP